MIVLVFGSFGMLGRDLVKVFKDNEIYTFSSSEVDIRDRKRVFEVMDDIQPHIVINAAAYTNVDECEKNKKFAMEVNGESLINIANACKKNKSTLIHISTDYVFDGKKKSGYKENDMTNPINIYGESKAKGEYEIVKTMDNYYIIRTAWLYGHSGKNFVETIINLAKNKDSIDVVDDQVGSPTNTYELALQVRRIVDDRKDFGIYHITNEGSCSWFEFATKIVSLSGLNCRVNPMSSKDFARPAKRPKYSVLVNTKIKRKLPNWEESLKKYIIERSYMK